MESYLVTGAAGFIGSNLVEELLERGENVTGIDNFETGYKENLKDFYSSENFEFVEGDLRDRGDIDKAVEGVDYVLHHGALASVPRSIEDPVRTTQTNCLGTTNLLKSSVENGVEKVVVASSSAVYGRSEELPKKEDMSVDPVSPYALSKYWTERLAVQFDRYYEVDTVAFRYFNVFGPRQDPEGEYAAVIPKFIQLMLQGERPTIYGDGEQSRDFVHVDNVVEANIEACETDISGEVMNIASGEAVTINGLVEKLNEVLGTDIRPEYDDPRPGDVRHSKASIEKAKEEMGYEVSTGFDEGLEKTVEYYREEV